MNHRWLELLLDLRENSDKMMRFYTENKNFNYYKAIRILNTELRNGHVSSCTCVTDGDDLIKDFVLECVLQCLNKDAV